ncbi:MAG: hypothetical protein EXR51_11730 [Dehalococcoidia bacterium]|nr:hypothetical protein [Dehalococcoidia bacterium]
MAVANSETRGKTASGITSIKVRGYKSILEEQCFEIRPLTVIAGINSSGKSSAIQPLLLLKQTLESSFDPGPLLLNGPNLHFTSADQLFSVLESNKHTDEFSITISALPDTRVGLIYRWEPGKGIQLDRMSYSDGVTERLLHPEMTQADLKEQLPELFNLTSSPKDPRRQWTVFRDRCFYRIGLLIGTGRVAPFYANFLPATQVIAEHILRMIHVPALRGNPERTYPTTAVGTNFPGTFEKYVASVVSTWQSGDDRRLHGLKRTLRNLKLSGSVRANRIDDIQVELRVGRQLGVTANEDDSVNVADVGYGVSQVLPVLVALLVAEAGQLVYIEQPEIHLHPQAQSSLAATIADAAKRGVRVIIETHSDLLLLGLQTLVAQGKLAPELVKLHWFSRNAAGYTRVQSADIDSRGSFGEWPVDFSAVVRRAEDRYLDAAEPALTKGPTA